MRSVPIFKFLPELESQWISLIDKATPVYQLKKFSSDFNHSKLYVKREDLTSELYGGNKVRNLEFLLGQAKYRGADNILSLAPLGSNFVAALAAQAQKVEIPVKCYHFEPHLSEQMIKHAYYSKAVGAQLKTYRGGYLPSLFQSTLHFSSDVLFNHQNSFVMPTGGSSLSGAMGHVNAFLEMLEQVEQDEIPCPDYLVVGAGTCGTIAGLLAAKILTNHPVNIVGVRCVDKIICNKWNISRLCNQVLTSLGSDRRIKFSEINLVDNGAVKYGQADGDAVNLMKSISHSEGISLDTTYTTKVVSYLTKLMSRADLKNANFLYWHTFSNVAMSGVLKDIRLLNSPTSTDSMQLSVLLK
ncbi:MAG: pyridoxal-phosphate dependent enzyme [Bacteriovorax sp.]|nr:pyridoxal-phosphate dependent enzyme [Bacteriovorax sp.]